MKKVAALLTIAALALAACGGDDDDSSGTMPKPKGGAEEVSGGGGGGGGKTLALSADPDGALEYDTDQLDATAGPVTIDFDNPAAVSHDVTVEDSGGTELGRTPIIAEDQASLDVEVKAGEYTYYCSVPGHREGGMEGTLAVK